MRNKKFLTDIDLDLNQITNQIIEPGSNINNLFAFMLPNWQPIIKRWESTEFKDSTIDFDINSNMTPSPEFKLMLRHRGRYYKIVPHLKGLLNPDTIYTYDMFEHHTRYQSKFDYQVVNSEGRIVSINLYQLFYHLAYFKIPAGSGKEKWTYADGVAPSDAQLKITSIGSPKSVYELTKVAGTEYQYKVTLPLGVKMVYNLVATKFLKDKLDSNDGRLDYIKNRLYKQTFTVPFSVVYKFEYRGPGSSISKLEGHLITRN